MNEYLLEFTVVFHSYRKRTISEVQLMHNVREHKQVGERQDWLQEKLKDIIVASAKPQHGQWRNTKICCGIKYVETLKPTVLS